MTGAEKAHLSLSSRHLLSLITISSIMSLFAHDCHGCMSGTYSLCTRAAQNPSVSPCAQQSERPFHQGLHLKRRSPIISSYGALSLQGHHSKAGLSETQAWQRRTKPGLFRARALLHLVLEERGVFGEGEGVPKLGTIVFLFSVAPSVSLCLAAVRSVSARTRNNSPRLQ